MRSGNLAYIQFMPVWIVKRNYTISVCEKLGFKMIGRQRQCHLLDGVFKDRILFDILHSEFKEPSTNKHLKLIYTNE